MSQLPSVILHGASSYDSSLLRLQCPTTFAQVAQPAGPLQSTASWSTYRRRAKEAYNKDYHTQRQELGIVDVSWYVHTNVPAAVLQRVNRIVEIEFAVPPSANLPWSQPSFLQRLQDIESTVFDALLQHPPAGFSQHPLYQPKDDEDMTNVLLLAPSRAPEEFRWGRQAYPWDSIDSSLPDTLEGATLAAANALLHLRSCGLGDGYCMDIVRGRPFEKAYPDLYDSRNSRTYYDERTPSLDFALVTGTPSTRRISASILLRPFHSLTFIAYVIERMQDRYLSTATQGAVVRPDRQEEKLQGPHPWQNADQASLLGEHILTQFEVTGAPMVIVSTGYEMVVLERLPAAREDELKLSVHSTVLAQLGPDPPAEPDDDQAVKLMKSWRISTERNLPSAVALLAVLANGLPHHAPFSPVMAKVSSLSENVKSSASSSPMGDNQDSTASVQLGAERRCCERLPSNSNDGKGASVATQALLYQRHRFAAGIVCRAHYACLIPADQDVCVDLPRFHQRTYAPCSQPSHQRVIVKLPRNEVLEWKAEEPEAEDLAEQLDDEAELYSQLAHLQGSVLPTYYGKWDDACEDDFQLHAYEDVGTSLANEPGVESLKLSAKDLAFIKLQFKYHLEQLHKAGYVHGDIHPRNLCVRRVRESELVSRLECRLIDLSHAHALTSLSARESAGSIGYDHKLLEEEFKRLERQCRSSEE